MKNVNNWVWLVACVTLFGCGTLELLPADGDVLPNLEETVAAQVQATVAAQQGDTLAEVAATPTPLIEDTAVAAETPPTPTAIIETVAPTEAPIAEVETAQTVNLEPAWGEPFCPPAVPVCIRPYAVESVGGEQVLRVEVWGTADPFPLSSNRVQWKWRADGGEATNVFGNNCHDSYVMYPIYQAGFGHLSEICFRMAERPLEIRLEFEAPNFRPVVPFAVDENMAPAGDWSHFSGARPLAVGETLQVGAAAVTIENVTEQDDFVLLEVTIHNPSERRLLVYAPEWIVVGPQLRFNVVDAAGQRSGWHEGRMQAYNPRVGGEIGVGESQQGYVVLQKPTAEWGLQLRYGAPNLVEDDAVTLLP